ncbi:MAG: glycosyltransferase [Cyclobacteriaceae bacterium]
MDEASMFSVVDCNNFWSPSGGGVRRYHLEKMEFYKDRKDVKYAFVMHDKETYTEQIGENAFIEHLKVPKVYGNWEYRYLVKRKPLAPILKRLNPDVIEIGSPYFMPRMVNKIIAVEGLKSKMMGFWHADFPVTYIKRILEGTGETIAHLGEKQAWSYARKHYNRMSGIMVSSRLIKQRMELEGLQNVNFLPLGVDSTFFHPSKRDEAFALELKQGNPERVLMFFPHRFSKEKGLDIIIKAYPLMCKELKLEPVLVIAGTGPYESLAREASEKYQHVHLRGFIECKEEMAKYYASSDIGFALSKWETFGLSLLESLSSGLPLVGANEGAAFEHISESSAGIVVDDTTPQLVADAVAEMSKLPLDDLRLNARQYAAGLTWESCFENQLNLYQSIK